MRAGALPRLGDRQECLSHFRRNQKLGWVLPAGHFFELPPPPG